MSAVMTDDELDYLHATTFGDGHLRLIREHKELRAKAKAAPQMYEALKRGRQKLATYVGVFDGDKELITLLALWDAALKAASGEQE